jgi:putative ABC transport system permease protein
MKGFRQRGLFKTLCRAFPHSLLGTRHSALHLRLIRLIGVIVPRRLRSDWRQEWEAEIRYRERLLAKWERLDWQNKIDLLRRTTSAFWDALILQPRRLEDEMFQDLAFGWRMLIKHPGLTLLSILTLALGIGANSAIFSIVNAVVLRPLPYHDAARIVAIEEISKEGTRIQVTPANFLDWRAQNRVFAHLAAIFSRTANLSGTAEAERINLAVTSANFFEVFATQPQEGRFFLPGDEQAGRPNIIVIGHGLWQRRFGSATNAIGQSITIDGKTYTIVGIAPAGFQYPERTEAWVPPLRLAPEVNETADVTRLRGFGYLSAVARLKPGVTLREAAAEIETITGRLRQQYPETNNNRFNRVVSLQTHLVGETDILLWLLLGAVTFVLLIACANVANLLLARAAVRQKEMAIRTALGASGSRLMRQLLTESLLLAMIGGLCGLLLAWQGVDLLTQLLPRDFPRLNEISLDYAVLGFTFCVSLLTGLIFGFAPAWQVTRVDFNEAIKDGARGSSAGRQRLRGLLVVSEIALSLVLLIGAGLLFRSFMHLQAIKTGFESAHALSFRLTPSGANFKQDDQYIAYYQRVAERLKSLSGVDSVGSINTLPLSKGPTFNFRVEGRPLLPLDQWPGANYRNVSPDYFRTLKIPILQGRAFSEGDNTQAPLVAIINQAAAERYFVGENPLGKRFNFGGTAPSGTPIWFEIVGVVSNVRNIELTAEPEPEIYTAARQDAFASMYFVIRTTVEPAKMSAAVRQAAQEIDRAQPVSDLRTVENIVSSAVTQPKINLILLGIFAGVALLLSAAGIYGIVSYSVTQRTHEIGIRVALGARAGDVLKLIVQHGMKLTLIGIGFGLAASAVLMRLAKHLLYGISATDPLTFAVIAAFLAGISLLACYLPARRATKVDPLIALRQQ